MTSIEAVRRALPRPLSRLPVVAVLACCALIAACGGGGGSSSSSSATYSQATTALSTPTVTSPTGNNVVGVVVDGGPTGSAHNMAFVTVKICSTSSPGTCATVDHVQVDTGSVGLRLYASAINSSNAALLSTSSGTALTWASDSNGHPIGECYAFVSSYIWGSVRLANVTIGTEGQETAASMPIQVIGDSNAGSNPSSDQTLGWANGSTSTYCGGHAASEETNTVASSGTNGVLGIGTVPLDCGVGANCVAHVTSGPTHGYTSTAFDVTYYDCNTPTACVEETGTVSPLPNPVTQVSYGAGNGSSLTLNSSTAYGTAQVNGYLIFGIGNAGSLYANNLGSATVMTLDSTYNSEFTVNYAGSGYTASYIDSGTNAYGVPDNSITKCSNNPNPVLCPGSLLTLTGVSVGYNAANASANFWVGNPNKMSSSAAAWPAFAFYSQSTFVWGLPFFYSRTVYTGLAGTTATSQGSTVSGPFYAY